MPSKKKKYNARFPPARIKKIMQSDDEVGKVAAAVPVIISRALELFVESLLIKTSQITSSKSAKTLTPLHLKQCILSETKFDFLKELVQVIPDNQNYGDENINIDENETNKIYKYKESNVSKPKNRGKSVTQNVQMQAHSSDDSSNASSEDAHGSLLIIDQNSGLINGQDPEGVFASDLFMERNFANN